MRLTRNRPWDIFHDDHPPEITKEVAQIRHIFALVHFGTRVTIKAATDNPFLVDDIEDVLVYS